MYQIITYDRETGVDEHREYSRRREAVSAAKRSLIFNPNTAGDAEGVIVYDLRRRKIADIFGYFPERYRPAEA